jgi:hypothetical protein
MIVYKYRHMDDSSLSPSAADALTRLADSGFSEEVQLKCARWHQRSADLLAMLDGMLSKRELVIPPLIDSAEVLIAEARAILIALRLALSEVDASEDPVGEAAAQARARLPPLAPAAADAIQQLSDAQISAVRAMKVAPPAPVRLVVTCVCSILRLEHQPAQADRDALTGLATWEESQALLARSDFTRSLKRLDPRVLHAHRELAALVRGRLAELGRTASSPRRIARADDATPWRRVRVSARGSGAEAAGGSVAQTALMLRAAVRGGGEAVGQLFLWCSRVLAAAADLEELAALEEAREAEAHSLTQVLSAAQAKLEELEKRRQHQDQHVQCSK